MSTGWSPNVAAHEIMHTIGGVQITAPHSNTPNYTNGSSGHCSDEYDRMCEQGTMQYICKDSSHNSRFDCNHDDYYSTNPPAGSYLATHWNTANSAFLIGGGIAPTSGPIPTPTSAVTNTPAPTLPVGSNLLLNSSFETNNNGTPINWSSGVYDTTVSHAGNVSLRIDGGGDRYAYQNTGPTSSNPYPTLKPGTTYTLQGWIKTQNVLSTDFGVQLRYSTTQLTARNEGTVTLKGTNDWTFVTKTFTTPTDYTAGRLDLHAATTTTTGIAWFDDVALCEGTCGTVVNPTNTPIPTLTPTPTKIPSSDTTKPTVTITNPLNGAVVARRGNVTIAASASDNVGVDRVTFSVGGNTSTVYNAPYSYNWSVAGKPNARYTITVTAYDAANNSASQTITVTSSK